MKVLQLISRLALVGILVFLMPVAVQAQLGVAEQTMGVTGASVSGEIEFMVADDLGDMFSAGTMIISGQAWIIPRNILIDLPCNRLSLQQIFAQAPPEALALGESGLASSDSSLRGRGGATAHILGNQMPDGRNIAGDVFIQKDVDFTTGTITYINYDEGYFRLNGEDGLDVGGTMCRVNDPDGVHTIQTGAGCAGGPNCSADPRFTNDPGSYTVTFSNGYPMCIPSTIPRDGNPGADATSGEGDTFCPHTNRMVLNPNQQTTQGLIVDNSVFFAPMLLGDNLALEGNKEVVDGVSFFSAHSVGNGEALLTRDSPDQPSYIVADEVEWDAPGFANERAKALFIGFSTLLDSQVDMYAIHIDPATNEGHEYILASTRNNPQAINHGIGQGAGGIFKVSYDIDFLKGAPVGPRSSPCIQLALSGYPEICPRGGTMDEEFAVLAPISREMIMRTVHAETLNPGVTAINIQGEEAQHDEYLTGCGIGHPEFGEIDLNRMWWPMVFAGEPWNLDRRLGPGGCYEGQDGLPGCEPLGLTAIGSESMGLDPFPFSGLNPNMGIQGGGNLPPIADPIADPITGEVCGNGQDDDGDGLFDCDDPECEATNLCVQQEQAGGEIGEAGFCGNFVDDDNDGLTDCADPECASSAACAGLGAQIGLQFVPTNLERSFAYWPFTYVDLDGDPLNGAEHLMTEIIWDNLSLMPNSGTTASIPLQPQACGSLNSAPQVALPGLQGIDVLENQPATVLESQIATDPDGDRLTLSFGVGSAVDPVTGDPVPGTLESVNGNYTYTPSPNWTGVETFTFTATDSHGGMTTGILSFDVH
ncbi:MAG: Ig-like domain-containing protein [Planctomycetota bacterium]